MISSIMKDFLDQRKYSKPSWFMNDPQFASLKPLEQIYILIIIYNKLESVLNKKDNIPIEKRLKGFDNKLPPF